MLQLRTQCFAAAALICLGGAFHAIYAADQPPIPLSEYAARRAALRARIGDGMAVLFGNSEPAGSEAFHTFHQESNFLYLTGHDLPGAMLLIVPFAVGGGGEKGGSGFTEILYIPPRDRAAEVWTGPQLDPDEATTAARLGIASVRSTREFATDLERLAKRVSKIYTKQPSPHAAEDESAPERARLEKLRKLTRKNNFGSIEAELTPLRQIKSANELALIRGAVDCTLKAHYEAGRALKPGLREYQVAALMKYVMEREGCTVTGFDPIVGSGPRSTILHYIRGEGSVSDGDLVVLDVGGEYRDYSADITRTLPANGKFTPRQREIYEIVLGAQNAVLNAVRPGARLYGAGDSLHNIARSYLDSHGKDQKGESLGQYFTHGIGHQVGLDVHDAEDRRGALKEGMVIAIEPGLYLPEENIGVRIEDNVLVTKDGGELLSGALPRTVEAVEQWMAGK
jgi:Xaa-Pro aminopeptidase